ncbi:MAG TPA: ESPR-type extended signal peptide-containing protein, partial [Luteibacter sp.]|nr:ESPR-type extended signal peptide-containing protein [Luteibacter sp.]
MNRIYRIVFNRSLGLRQVVSELARSRGKGGTRIRRMALSISAAIETFNQPLSMTVPSPAPHRPGSSRRRYAQAVGLALPVAMSLGVMFPVAAHADTHLGSSTIGVNLSDYPTGNPFFVDLGITIVSTSTDGISGGPAAYTLTNNGSIASGINSAGVLFAGGGSLTNNGGILGGTFGVYLGGTSTSTVTNSGSISGIGYFAEGIQLRGGGVVSNTSTGVITGTSYGVRVFGVSTVTNDGRITGTAAGGVYMEVGGTLVNHSSITGGSAGVITNSGALDVTNSGNIVATSAGGIGVYLHGGGSVTNTGTATISGALNGIRGFGAPVDVNNTDGASISATDTGTGIGIDLKAGGSVTNNAFSEINGGYIGVRINGGPGTITNSGAISSTAALGKGIELVAVGGSVINNASGSISGNYGVLLAAMGTVTNSGTITGPSRAVYALAGGTLTNQAGGYLGSGNFGVLAKNAAFNVTNYGRIVTTQTISNGVRLSQGGTVVNAANATISAADTGIYILGGGSATNGNSSVIYGQFTGILIGGSGTITNAGTISTFINPNNSYNSYNAVLFTDNNNRLILQTGSSLIGAATATGTGNELQLEGNGSSSNTFSGFGTVSATAGTQWALSNDFSVAGSLGVSTDTGSQLVMSGNVDSQGLTKQGDGTLVIDGTATNSGNAEVMAGRLIVGSDIAHAGAVLQGDVQVDSGAIIGGHGELSGSLNVLGGAHLAPGNSIGTLTVGGDLTLAQSSQLDFEFGAPGVNASQGASDSVAVHGNLSLNGAVLNISNTGSMGPGLYNLFTYDGTLTESNGGIAFGSTSGGAYAIQNLTASKQINLIDATSVTLAFWNA